MGHYIYSNLEFICYIEQIIFYLTPKENNTILCATSMHTVDTDTLHNEQKWDIMCKKLVSQIQHSNANIFQPVTLSADDVLQKHQHVHGLQHDVTMLLVAQIMTGYCQIYTQVQCMH